ncbi:uncharacterized protein DEA37_0012496 [Paragonimus westermani]|uniref:Uncharacterized protein n=1 Tax=Paragonimus westermani TaxID=34504 RepID=A0A5J4N4Y5_9TREM|nr:uncharacterized protein DEA37_0012496 [Paragonimus westermani]
MFEGPSTMTTDRGTQLWSGLFCGLTQILGGVFVRRTAY